MEMEKWKEKNMLVRLHQYDEKVDSLGKKIFNRKQKF